MTEQKEQKLKCKLLLTTTKLVYLIAQRDRAEKSFFTSMIKTKKQP